MPRKDNHTISPYKGLHQDFQPDRQPEGTYRYALNAVNESHEGDMAYLSSEKGNIDCAQVPEGYFVIGHVLLDDGSIAIFSTDNSTSEIGLLKDCVYSTIVSTPCLNFNVANQIEATARVRLGCRRVVYFTDGINPIRTFDFDNIEAFKTAGDWDCDKFKLFSDFTQPNLAELDVRDGGGSIAPGMYQFAIQYTNGDLSSTSYSYPTNPVPVVPEQLDSYDDVDGGTFALDGNTSKSIYIRYEDVDTNFDFLNLVVIRNIDGVTTAYLVDTFQIVGTEFTYTFAGINEDTASQIDVGDIVVPQTIYDTAKTITQKDKRLVIGNLREKNINVAELQRTANAIRINYVTTAETINSLNNASPKNDTYYLNRRSYMRDEVYAFGIEFLYADGYISPVMHIPGRLKNFTASGSFITPGLDLSSSHRPPMVSTWDGDTITDADEIAHISGATEAERWQVYNTGVRTQAPSYGAEYFTKGEMAYYETETAYPDDVDCNGDRIYPTGNIRHHKFPDTSVEPHFTEDSGAYYTHPIGIEVTNINYPTSDIVGHRVVVSKRTFSNKSVVDKGLLFHNIEREFVNNIKDYVQCAGFNAEVPYYAFNSSEKVMLDFFNFIAPVPKFENNQIISDYIKTEGILSGTPDEYSSTYDNNLAVVFNSFSNLPALSPYNAAIDATSYIDPDTILRSGIFAEDFNNTTAQDGFLVKLDRNLPDYSNNHYGQTPIVIGPNTFEYANPAAIQPEVQAEYVALKRYLPNMYASLSTLTYYPTTDAAQNGNTIVFGGDVFITRLAYRKTYEIDQSIIGTPDDIRYGDAPIFWTESEINVDLRHSEDDTDPAKQFYPKHTQSPTDLTDFLQQAYTVENHYRYNTAFSSVNDTRVNFPLELAYDFCSQCTNEYPYRMAYSEVGFFEEKSDTYKIFLANNYKDIIANRGTVQKLKVHKDDLYIATEESLWFQPTSEQQIQTDISTVYIGTGEFFAVDEKELVSTDSGYAGSRNQWSFLATDGGMFFVSDDRIFLLQTNLSEISNTGLRSFLSENLPFDFPSLFKFYTGEDFPNQDNHANPNGIGIHAVYDERLKRIIVTKRDYAFADGNLFQGLLSQERYKQDPPDGESIPKIVWNDTNKTFQKVISYDPVTDIVGVENIDFTDRTYFEDRSWTLSYSLLSNSWVSYHSYIPLYMFSDRIDWYTNIDNAFKKQNKGQYQTFYGITYPMIIDHVFVKSPLSTAVYDSYEYHSSVLKYNQAAREFYDIPKETFDKVLFYNSYQSSGLMDISINEQNPFGSIPNNLTAVVAERGERVWRISKIQDLSTENTTLFTRSWADIDFRNSYPIDKVPANIDYTKNRFSIKDFRDKFLGARLYYYNDNNNKLTFKFATDKFRYSPR